MKNNIMEPFSISENNKKDSLTLLKNCGFSPNFFYALEKNVLMLGRCSIKKIKSANDIIFLQKQEENCSIKKRIYEAEDKDIFNKRKDENSIYLNYNSNGSINNLSSYTTIPSQDCLNKNLFDIYNQKTKYVSAYKSKHKIKYNKLYEINSLTLNEKNKYKLYHKCCYPGCNRTFSSSGWLKAHLKEHLKQIHNSKYCKLFEKYILSEKIKYIKKKNNFYFNNTINQSHISSDNNLNNINIDNTNNNKLLFFNGINSPKPPSPFFENNNILKGEQKHFSYYHFNNDNYKGYYYC